MKTKNSKKYINIVIFIFGAIVGSQLGQWLLTSNLLNERFGIDLSRSTLATVTFDILAGILFGFIFLIFIPLLTKFFKRFINDTLGDLKNVTVSQLIMWVIGLIVGLVIAALVCIPINNMDLPAWIRSTFTLLIYTISLYICSYVTSYKTKDVQEFFRGLSLFKEDGFKDTFKGKNKKLKLPIGNSKILDTSVIIDGRIFDILNTGFVDGPIIIPNFVLLELQQIADSKDNIKRNRGRRGLDILNKMQSEIKNLEFISLDKDYEDITEVDTKLLKLAIDIDAKVMTIDYNLNKVAEFQGVDVLNINELSNAVKTVVLPGEELFVRVLREGKEAAQGIAYLDDGTMIVVEDGRHHIGKELKTKVTSVLQTAAGRMIFAKPI